jgi:hypothetical protein
MLQGEQLGEENQEETGEGQESTSHMVGRIRFERAALVAKGKGNFVLTNEGRRLRAIAFKSLRAFGPTF